MKPPESGITRFGASLRIGAGVQEFGYKSSNAKLLPAANLIACCEQLPCFL